MKSIAQLAIHLQVCRPYWGGGELLAESLDFKDSPIASIPRRKISLSFMLSDRLTYLL